MAKISEYDEAAAALTTHEFFALDPAQTGADKNQRVPGNKVATMIQAQAPVAPTKIKSYTFAGLSLVGDSVAIVTDSNTAVWGATIGGGGSNTVLAFGNGSKWTVAGVCTTIVIPEFPVPDNVTTETATGGIWAGTGTITNVADSNAVWTVRLADRVALKNGVATAFVNVLELWKADDTIWAFYGDSWAAISGPSTAVRPKMPTTPGLRFANPGPKTLTLPVGCVQISPGNDVQAIINANPAGTVFGLHVGTYTQQSITLRDGDQLHGEHNGSAGVILNGNAITPYAITVPIGVDYCVIKNLYITGYTNPVQYCSIMGLGAYTLIQDCDVTLAVGGGIWGSNYNLIIRNRSHHNAQIGYKVVSSDTGVAVVTGCTFDSNEFDNNDPTHFFYSVGEQGGGKAWNTAHLTMWYNFVHHNDGSGLWTDFDNWATVYWYNVSSDNTVSGIEHEISYNASIVGNLLERNGSAASSGWFFAGAGVSIENSQGVTTGTYAGWIEIYNNVIVAGPYGRLIALRDQNRGSSGFLRYTPDPWSTKNVYVHHNSLDGSAGFAGAVQGMVRDWDWANTDFYVQRNIVFDYNDYNMGFNGLWTWNDNGFMNWSAWQAAGFDLHGTNAPDPDTSASHDWSANHKAPSVTLSGSDLIATGTVDKNLSGRGTTSNTAIASGVKRYCEITVTNVTNVGVGLSNGGDTYFDDGYLGRDTQSIVCFAGDGSVFHGALLGYAAAYTAGHRVNMAIDGGNKVWFGVDGVWNGDPAAGTGGFDISTMGTVFPAYNVGLAGSVTINMGPTFTDTPPTGFTAFP